MRMVKFKIFFRISNTLASLHVHISVDIEKTKFFNLCDFYTAWDLLVKSVNVMHLNSQIDVWNIYILVGLFVWCLDWKPYYQVQL